MKSRRCITICCCVVLINLLVYYSRYIGHDKTRTHKKCHSFITSSFLTGRALGNVMFQYASMYGISQTLEMVPVLTEEIPLLAHFRLTVPHLTDTSSISKWPQALEVKSNAYDNYLMQHLNPCYNLTLVGYFQSWRYFQHTEDEVREQFRFIEDIVNEVQKDLHDMLTQDKSTKTLLGKVTFIGIHIRRGDFLETDKVAYGYTVADLAYIKRAIRHMEKNITQFENNIYVVSTDDLNWTKTNLDRLNKRIYYSAYDDPYKDLALLSQCNHSIITVGTFSWWSGWLAGGQVIYYSNFPRANSKLERGFSLDKRDYFPSSWIGL